MFVVCLGVLCVLFCVLFDQIRCFLGVNVCFAICSQHFGGSPLFSVELSYHGPGVFSRNATAACPQPAAAGKYFLFSFSLVQWREAAKKDARVPAPRAPKCKIGRNDCPFRPLIFVCLAWWVGSSQREEHHH